MTGTSTKSLSPRYAARSANDSAELSMIGRFLKSRSDAGIVVATKMGRRVMPQDPEAYTLRNFRAWADRSSANLGVDILDLVQLHCPPSAVYSTDAVFDALDALVEEGRITAYGVSVETRAEALTAIARPGVATVQIILNMLRLGPLDEVLPAARAAGVGIIARVPLASGLLSGRYDETTRFARTTTARTTGTGRRPTSVRRSPGSTSPPGWPRYGGWLRWCHQGSPWRSSRCAGSSTSLV